MAESYAHPEVLVSADWVEEHLNDPKVRIVESDEDVLLYDMGHIPGAVKIDWQGDLQDQLIRDYINAEKFAAICSRSGIANDTTVVFYGDKSNWWACYAFWAFKLFGHEDCRIMNGGRKLWLDQKRPTTTEVPHYPPDRLQGPGEPRGRRSASSATRSWRMRRRASRCSTSAAPRSSPARSCTWRTIPRKARCAAATSRARRRPLEPRRQRGRHVQVGRGAEGDLRGRGRAQADRRRRRLLPDRRAVEPDLVRPDLPARLPQGPQLRRLLVRVGQPRPGPDRQGGLSRAGRPPLG